MEQNPPVNPPSYKADNSYYWDFVTFLVEGTLFRVPRYNLIAQSELFATKYGIDKDASKSTGLIAVTDYSPATLVKLDVAISDFRAFPKVLYPMVSFPKYEVDPKPAKPTPFQVEPSLTTTEWISVLKLSTQWHFKEVRAMAVDALSSSGIDHVMKANLAKEFYVKKWLLSAYKGLVQRSESITVEEAEKLGWKNAIILFQIREKDKADPKSGAAAALKSRIREAFSGDFNIIREAQCEYCVDGRQGTVGEAVGNRDGTEDMTDTDDEIAPKATPSKQDHGSEAAVSFKLSPFIQPTKPSGFGGFEASGATGPASSSAFRMTRPTDSKVSGTPARSSAFFPSAIPPSSGPTTPSSSSFFGTSAASPLPSGAPGPPSSLFGTPTARSSSSGTPARSFDFFGAPRSL